MLRNLSFSFETGKRTVDLQATTMTRMSTCSISSKYLLPARISRMASCVFRLILFVIVLQVAYFSWNHGEQQIELEELVDPQCACADESGKKHNLCYILPENNTIRGARFNCSFLEIITRLGLTNTGSNYIDLSKNEMPDPVFVTAFSDNHWDEAKRLISTVRKHWRKQKIIIYDLGLTTNIVDFLKTLCLIEIRKFNFELYPKYVEQLHEYRWKPIIIAEALNEFGAIWYMDSSIVFKKGNLSHVYDLVRCRSRIPYHRNVPPIPERDYREASTPHESGWDINIWNDSVTHCQKATYLFHGYTGHGIYPATSQHLYEWIPTNTAEITKPKAKMYEAGFIFAVKTVDTVKHILKWYILCALEENCMASRENPDVALGCQFGSDRFKVYAHCHRFDQSVVNLLAANANFYDRHYYTSEIVDFFNVVRGAGGSYKLDFLCEEPK